MPAARVSAYATSKSPTGPFAYGGVIVSHRVDANSGNIHGGLAKLNGQWYIFYHRMSNRTVFSRRACAERITIEADGSIKEVEQTSLGFETSLNPYKFTPADIACVFRGGNYVTELDKRTHPVMGNKDDCVVGYKYFDFGDTILAGAVLAIHPPVPQCGRLPGRSRYGWATQRVAVKNSAAILLTLNRACKGAWRELTIPVRNLSGRHAVYFKFASDTNDKPIADIRSFAFTRDTR